MKLLIRSQLRFSCLQIMNRVCFCFIVVAFSIYFYIVNKQLQGQFYAIVLPRSGNLLRERHLSNTIAHHIICCTGFNCIQSTLTGSPDRLQLPTLERCVIPRWRSSRHASRPVSVSTLLHRRLLSDSPVFQPSATDLFQLPLNSQGPTVENLCRRCHWLFSRKRLKTKSL